MYEVEGASLAQRWLLAAAGAAWLAVAWWILEGGGIGTVGSWLGKNWTAGDGMRRALLGAGFSIYFVRILLTEFVFLKRGVSWSEVFSIAPWLLTIFVWLSLEGGMNPARPGWAGTAGVALFVAGSWMNTYAEYTRHRWKQRPENRGRLYTGGLFRWSRHPNYLGDVISFSGLALVAGAWPAAAIPALMLAGFVFVNVPVLDGHMQEHYGAQWEEYARRTRKLAPWIW